MQEASEGDARGFGRARQGADHTQDSFRPLPHTEASYGATEAFEQWVVTVQHAYYAVHLGSFRERGSERAEWRKGGHEKNPDQRGQRRGSGDGDLWAGEQSVLQQSPENKLQTPATTRNLNIMMRERSQA